MKSNEKYNSKEWKNALGMAEWCKSDKCTVEQIAQDEYANNKHLDRLYDENKKLKSDKEYLMKELDRLQRKVKYLNDHEGMNIPYDETVLENV